MAPSNLPRLGFILFAVAAMLAASAAAGLAHAGDGWGEDQEITGYPLVDGEIMSYVMRLPSPSMPSRRQIERIQDLDQQIDETVDRANPDGFIAVARQRMARVRALYDGPAANLFDCLGYYLIADQMDDWSYAERWLEAARNARRLCEGSRRSLQLLAALIDAQYGAALSTVGRPEEGQAFLRRAFAALSRTGFTDSAAAIHVAHQLAECLAKLGDAEGGRDRLLEVQRAVRGRGFDPGARIELLLALSINATARGARQEAERWATLAESDLSVGGSVATRWTYSVSLRLAETRYAQFDARIAANSLFNAVSRTRETHPRSVELLLLLLREATALYSANDQEQAEARLQEALGLAAQIDIPAPYRRYYLQLLSNYYGIARQCPGRLAASSQLYNLARAGALDERWTRGALQDHVSALLGCGQAREAIQILDAMRPRNAPPPGDWNEIARRWQRAIALADNGQFEPAVEDQRRVCDEVGSSARSSFATPDRRGYTIEGLTYSMARCYFALSIANWRWAEAARAAGSADVARRSEDAFLAAQSAIQSAPDDGISFSLGLEAARSRGGAVAAAVVEYESLLRRMQSLQRGFEDRLETDANAGIEPQFGALRAREATLRSLITTQFPEYWSARLPQPIGVADLQGGNGSAAILRPNEVLLVVSLDEAAFDPDLVFAVSSTRFAAARIRLPAARLRELTQTIREQIQPRNGNDHQPPDFNLAAAHELHEAILGDPAIREVVDPASVILYVPTGALRQLPLGVLVTRPPRAAMARNAADFRSASWLIRDKAVAVFPTVSSLVRLRQRPAQPATGARPFLAFAEPNFQLVSAPTAGPAAPAGAGDRGSEIEARTARSAETGYPQLEGLSGQGIAEMVGVARALGAPEGSVVTGFAATEDTLMQLDRSGALRQARIIGFATHGLTPGTTGRIREPALALAVPALPGDYDGLLTASEIAGLSLNAELVLLSACDTGSLEAGRSVVGLSRAFLQAGARSLLVTYWRVPNDAGPLILPRMFAWRRDHPGESSARALQVASLALLDNAQVDGWHPVHWAAYVLIGDASPMSR